ncbi:MAG: 6-pyruvoyl-tetrahydropterin synthase-related protein [Acidimicrobiales bacterium]
MRRLAAWADRPRTTGEWAELAVTVAVLVACTVFVLGALHPSKLLTNTTPAGGDMGAHVWAPWFLRHHLFPHGRISGWAPAWYDGFPALTFYFPGPYVVIALLSYLLPYGIAFKLVAVSGLVALPCCAFVMGRLTGMKFPGPPLLAVATVPFLFDRYFTIWGGNIASALAGEFAFSISLCCALLFIGVFAKSMETGRYRWLAAALLAATLLSHLLPTFFAIAGAVIVWLLQPSRRRLGRAILIGVVGLAIAGFWLVPFAMRLGYSNDMGWERSTTFMKGLFPWMCNTHKQDVNVNCPGFNVVGVYTEHLKLVVALAAAGAIGGIVLRRKTTLLIAGLGAVFAGIFRFLPQGTLWNERMLPFWYLMLYFAAAAAVAESALAVGVLLGRTPRAAAEDLEPSTTEDGWAEYPEANDPAADYDGTPSEDAAPADGAEPAELRPSWAPAVAVPVLVALIVLTFVGQAVPNWSWLFARLPGHTALGGRAQQRNPNFVSSWADWNYSGYQKKAAYPEYRDVIDTMSVVAKAHGCGRAMWEYEPEEDRFGTPMALMLLPMWTNGCIDSQEGLFFESSSNVPMHFLNQSELSANPSRAMRDLPYRSYDITNGIAHLQLLGVKYYMAISPTAQSAAKGLASGAHPLLTLVGHSAPHQVSYSSGSTPGLQTRTWEVYEVADSATVTGLTYQPVVMTGVPTKAKGWQHIAVSWYQDQNRWDVPLAASGPQTWARVKGDDHNPPRVPVTAAQVTNVRMSDDRISFDVDRPGSPVLVKTSYFPNWQATGATGPWRVTPDEMVVVPTATHVSLHYGYTPVDNAGRLATIGGLAAAVWWWRRERRTPGGADTEALVVEADETPEASDDGYDPDGMAAAVPAGLDTW